MPGRLLLIALVLLLMAQAPAPAPSDELRALKKKAHELAITRPAEALAAAERALEIAEGLFGPDHVEVGEVLAELARLHAVRDRFADAEPLEQRAIAIMEKGLGADHPALADFLVRIAGPHSRRRFAHARPLYKRAVNIYERAWADDPKLPIKIFLLGYNFDALGHRGDAIPLYERARTLAEKTLAPDNPASLMFLGHLPYAYLVHGRYVDSERAVQRDMAVLARWFGSEQQEAVRSDDLRRLARVYVEQGYYADAERLYKRAHIIDLKPGETPSEEVVARELGPIYFAQGRYAEATEIYSRVFARLEAAYGPAKAESDALREKLKAMGKVRRLDDIKAREPLSKELARLYARVPSKKTMATILGALAKVQHRQGEYAEAETLFERALALLGDTNDQSAVIIMTDLAHLHVDQGRYGEAEQLYVRALELDEDDENWGRPLPRTGVDGAAILNGLGRLTRERNRLERAELLHKLALKILEGLGPDRFDVGGTLNDLAELYRSQGRFADAEPLYKRALEICERAT
jgi:tetratricopeptide (TPR) repeat protein